MQSKKKLIRKMAIVAAAVLALGLTGVVITLVVITQRREERIEEWRQERARSVEGARSYLAELAEQITAVPVDPTIVGEVQATYFAEVAQGRRFVWGMGAEGEFLFGVP